ncbi:MAG: hypothetical protein KKC76_01020 [Proteobacteria bacterium]|nr:hypothetical protein [Pseudomonadota bacterium]MBU4295797.1 hypothetical protein [Pseudomonadota bacterium]MCG2747821.1 hypothetical protein [Desulfobulbaceae bacterium]
MKKIISTVAALGLVMGVAGTASALDFSMSGQYVIDGVMLNNADGNDNSISYNAKSGGFDPYNDDAGTDSAWLHTFIVKPQLKVNDKITMFSELWFARYNVWGNQDDAADGQTIDVYTLYMEYMSPVGKIRAGRCVVPPWGGDFMSTYQHADRLMWWPSFVADPFELLVFTQKTTENDGYNNNDDADNDVYEIDLTYKTDKLLLLAGYDYYNYKGASDDNAPSNYDRQQHQLRAYGVGKIANFTIEGEWGWRFGDFADYDTEIAGVQEDQDVDAMALMLDASGQFDKLDVGMMYFWAEGQDDDILTHADADVTAAMGGAGTLEDGLGDDFNPYYILTGDLTGMLNSDVFNADPNMTTSGVNAIGVHSDFQVSDQLTLHGAIAYAWADTTDMVEAAYGVSVDDEYGWEIDLGAKYKLLDNLTYEVHAAYFNTGDFFDDIAKTAGQDSEDLYLLSHHLTMTF